METFSIQNIIDGQAIGVSITGMSIVFTGLLLISFYIALLPKILDFLSRKPATSFVEPPKQEEGVVKGKEEIPAPAAVTKDTPEDELNDIASVIGLVLQLEYERIAKVDNEQITITRNENRPSMWGSAGRMRKMPQRRTHA